MIKAVVFDIGGIVIDESATASRKILAEKYGFKAEDFSKFAKNNLEKSFIGWPAKEFFTELKKELGLDANPEELSKEWLKLRNKTSKINNKIKNLIIKLRKRYTLVCLTNTTILNDKSKARAEIYNLFNVTIKSTKAKAMKPQKEIYLALTGKLAEKGISPAEIVFVDNKEEYLEPAKNLGINTIFYTKYYKLLLELNKLGVKWG
jgi:epoxide hydrolase-like predicted phosphatase